MSDSQKFVLPALPYGASDLAPTISSDTVDLHYGKHHQAYFNMLNKFADGTKFMDMELDQVVVESFQDGHKKVFMCLAMMANKSHKSYVSYFKDVVESITTLNIAGQKNAISKEDLKIIIDQLQIKSSTSNSIADAINSISDKEKNALILITGSLYFCGEVLNMN